MLAQPGADPGIEKGGGAVASGARSQDFFGQFRGLFKKIRAKMGGRAPPSGSAPANNNLTLYQRLIFAG